MDDLGLELHVLHWIADEERWDRIPWDEWAAFRSWKSDRKGLPNIKEGTHHFVIVVHDEDGPPVNIIHHQYLLDGNGSEVHDNRAGLTAEEEADYHQIMVSPKEQPGDRERLEHIRSKLAFATNLPRPAHASLQAVLRTPAKPGSAAEKFLAQIDGPLH